MRAHRRTFRFGGLLLQVLIISQLLLKVELVHGREVPPRRCLAATLNLSGG